MECILFSASGKLYAIAKMSISKALFATLQEHVYSIKHFKHPSLKKFYAVKMPKMCCSNGIYETWCLFAPLF